jgi:amidase
MVRRARTKRETGVTIGMELHYLSLLEIAERIRRQDVTAETVTRHLLERIETHERRLHSIAHLLADSALDQARRADQEIRSGLYRGPLHGVPIGVKDLLWTKDVPTAAGMEVLRNFRPKEDATVVSRLKQAGAVIIAKLQMTEGATAHHHPSIPRPVNPWNAERWTGVSSSGSGIATAAGFCFGAIGSDTGGSIRMPSSANSLTGIKPTWGRVSRHGLVHLAESLDHVGPMARSAADAAVILQAIAGADPLDATALPDPAPNYLDLMQGPIDDLVLGIDWKFATSGVSQPVIESLRAALDVLERLGARVREIQFPWTDSDALMLLPVFDAELLAAHSEHFPANADRYGPWLRAALSKAASGSDRVALARAYMERERFKGRLRKVFRDVDLILMPALGLEIPTWEEYEQRFAAGGQFDPVLVRFTPAFNLSGTPTLTFPGGFTAQGLPIGLQLAADWLDEATLLRAGAAFQRVTAHHTRRPQLAAR